MAFIAIPVEEEKMRELLGDPMSDAVLKQFKDNPRKTVCKFTNGGNKLTVRKQGRKYKIATT